MTLGLNFVPWKVKPGRGNSAKGFAQPRSQLKARHIQFSRCFKIMDLARVWERGRELEIAAHHRSLPFTFPSHPLPRGSQPPNPYLLHELIYTNRFFSDCFVFSATLPARILKQRLFLPEQKNNFHQGLAASLQSLFRASFACAGRSRWWERSRFQPVWPMA